MNRQENADFEIAYDGTWYHDGAPIQRAALAKLFADRALRMDENGDYWLQTPFEKYPVDVKDVPFVIIDYEIKEDAVDLVTNMEDVVLLGPGIAWELRDEVPYVEVRDNLYARLSRSVYYNLVETFGEKLRSRGEVFPLGIINRNEK